MKCERCKRCVLRMKVSLYLDIPSTLANQLSKANLKKKDVRVEGAGWPTATYYCPGCGWFLRLAEGKKKKR